MILVSIERTNHDAKPRSSAGTFSLPDVDAAQRSERHTEDESHGHGQHRGQQAVKAELDQLKGGVASYPHSVEAVRGCRLRDDIFKSNLAGQPSNAKTKRVIITTDAHGRLWARTQAATSIYSGSNGENKGAKVNGARK